MMSYSLNDAAPTVWNNLPTDLTDELSSITIFKRNLKKTFSTSDRSPADHVTDPALAIHCRRINDL